MRKISIFYLFNLIKFLSDPDRSSRAAGEESKLPRRSPAQLSAPSRHTKPQHQRSADVA